MRQVHIQFKRFRSKSNRFEESLEKTKEQQNEVNKIIIQLHFRSSRKEKELKDLEKTKKLLLEDFGA